MSRSVRNPYVESILDRLVDLAPEKRVDEIQTAEKTQRLIEEAVFRDLLHLLNTRYRATSCDERLTHVPTSIANYGIPDFTSSSYGAAEDPDMLLEQIRRAVRDFEPRLENIRVTRISTDESDRSLSFQIDAVLIGQGKVTFESSLETPTGHFRRTGA